MSKLGMYIDNKYSIENKIFKIVFGNNLLMIISFSANNRINLYSFVK